MIFVERAVFQKAPGERLYENVGPQVRFFPE